MKKQPGFVLVLALLIMAMGSTLVISLFQRAVSYDRLHRLLLKQQQSRMLALQGIEIARAQLSSPVTLDKGKEAIDSAIAPFLYADCVQTFSLTGENVGLDGEIKVFISSEEGKINLNGLYDFQEKKYRNQMTETCNGYLEKKFGIEQFSGALESLLKKGPLEEVTQLVGKNFKGALFKNLDTPNVPALTDLFTLATPDGKTQPLYISDTLADLLQLEKQPIVKKERLEMLKKLAAVKGQVQWQTQWNELLAPLYKKGYNEIPDVFKKNLASKIETTAFLVISYGRVDGGAPVQKVCAYLEKLNVPETKTIVYTVKRLYWLS